MGVDLVIGLVTRKDGRAVGLAASTVW